MSCMTLTSGICRGCRDNVGGIKKAFFTNACDLEFYNGTGVGAFQLGTDGEIADYANSISWYPFVPSQHTGNYVETLNVSVENGTVYYNGVLTLAFNKMEQKKRNVIGEMAKGDLAIIFQDENNKYWWIGGLKITDAGGKPTSVVADSSVGCVLGGTSFQTGTAMADSNGGSLTFTIDMAKPAIEVIPKAGGKLESDLESALSASCASCATEVTPDDADH